MIQYKNNKEEKQDKTIKENKLMENTTTPTGKTEIKNKDVYVKAMKKLAFSSLKQYYTEKYIDSKLEIINKIEIDEHLENINDITFKKGILTLPNILSNNKVTTIKDMIELLSINDKLKELLTIYSIYIVSIDEKDTKIDKVIKYAIASYLASKNNNQLSNCKIGQLTFKTYNTTTNILENIIRELAIILGDDILYQTLKYGSKYLSDQIDYQTKKKGLGQKLITNITDLANLYKKERKEHNTYNILSKIETEKLLPMYDTLKKYSTKYKNSILNIIELKNFDFKVILKIDDLVDTSKLKELTEEEKQIINQHIKNFDDNWYDFSLVIFYPPVNHVAINDDGEKIYNGNDFSFINKFLSSVEYTKEEYDYLCDTLEKKWQSIQNIIINELIPRYIKNNRKIYIYLDEILKLSQYQKYGKNHDLSQKRTTKRLERKLNNK